MTQGIVRQADVLAAEAQGMPADLPTSTYEMIQRGAAINPDAPALSFFLQSGGHRKPECWTYRELVRDITRSANLFSRLGIARDAVVAYALPNLPETHFTLWGGEAAGIVCAINPLLEGNAIVELLNAAKAQVLVTLAPFPGTDLWAKIQPELANAQTLRHLVLVNLADRIRSPKRWLAGWLQQRETRRLHGRGGVRGAVPAAIQIHDFGQSLAKESGTRLATERQFTADDLSSFFCTGGTTGLPKIAMRRHGNEVANAWSAGQVLGDSIGAGKTVFCGLPLFHVNAAMVTGLLPFSKGAHVLLGTPQGYRGAGVIPRFWEIVEHHRVNFFSGVPTLYAALLGVPLGDKDIHSLEFGICGAAPMPVEVFRAFQERTGLRILEGYGLTEGACISSVNPPHGERRLGSVGLRLPGQAMKTVVLDEAGRYQRDCAVDETGVLTISGPNVFVGYILPQQNQGLWLELGDGRRWLNTGDLARCDADGYFWLTGRRKELIIRGGHNIDPAVIEEPLHRHPAVQLAAAVGRPDAHAGELPVAYVQLKPDAKASSEELTAFLRHEIGERAALPKHIRIVETMPLTAVGKIFKPALKRLEIVEALRADLENEGLQADVAAVEDKTHGIVLHVGLADPQQHARAAEILGRHPFAFSLTQDRAHQETHSSQDQR
ncbi:acyl-CoA synthetase [Paludibacterium purpuratum]|uniref:Fatty-acyl-CoA synthase n=1 Tax=Paludibacterium purpuratum TaxID=1144873 RepID=A0A4R7B2V2_9NEIS|nr:acyl-CoA synthetase [Paludibacterium purpuratum]TDR77861.1 fatty-acyl-CoA synthase [Paludibacterium purpuratum]